MRGSLARVLAHRGAHLEAAETLTEVLAAQEREIPRESNLPRCCLIGTLVRLGRLAEARAVLDRGRDGQRSFTEHGWAAVNSRFLDYEEIRLLVAEHQTSEAIALAQSLLQRLDADDLSAPWPKIGVVNRLVEALLAEDRVDEADERLARCSADVGPRRSRQMRWMFAQGESALAAWQLREGNGLEASRYLDRVRAACSEFAIDADAPYVDSARRIAAGEASPALLAVMRAGEIY